MKVIKFLKDAVLIKDGDIEAWVDVTVHNQDIICDWNAYIFDLTNSKDLALRAWQDDCDNFDMATSLAVETLERKGFIYQDEKGKWHTKNIEL